ncbi:hypothetical protein Emed_000424 [Eimeria media]
MLHSSHQAILLILVGLPLGRRTIVLVEKERLKGDTWRQHKRGPPNTASAGPPKICSRGPPIFDCSLRLSRLSRLEPHDEAFKSTAAMTEGSNSSSSSLSSSSSSCSSSKLLRRSRDRATRFAAGHRIGFVAGADAAAAAADAAAAAAVVRLTQQQEQQQQQHQRKQQHQQQQQKQQLQQQ